MSPLPTAAPQITLSIMLRREQIVVISQDALLLNVGIPSVLFLVADPLICHILALGASMKLQGHCWML